MNRYERMNQERKIVDVRKRVAAYCRVSTDHEDQANSFESQQRYFRQYIERNPDWELYEIFADEGISGTNTKKRSEFKRMIACAKEGDFDLIITKEISRFARNTLDSIYYTRDLKKHGVGVIFMNDNINTLDGDAELRLAIMSSIAQEESRKTSERVKWGQKRQMEQGVVFGVKVFFCTRSPQYFSLRITRKMTVLLHSLTRIGVMPASRSSRAMTCVPLFSFANLWKISRTILAPFSFTVILPSLTS